MTANPIATVTGMNIRTAPVFRIVVLQPTTLCNLNCNYCYLPGRDKQNLMAPAAAELIAAAITDQAASNLDLEPVTVLWHGGEPTATPLDHFRQLLKPFEPLRADGLIRHSIQTNATLITPEWIDVFVTHGFNVSVSLDGPPHLNAERINRAGRPAHDQVMAGCRALQQAGLAPHVICVITPATAPHIREVISYLDQAGFPVIGFNFEEHEGINTGRPMLTRDEARRVWTEILTYYRDTPGAADRFGIRELMLLARYLNGYAPLDRDTIPTICWNGDIVLLSPELAGVTSPRYGDFVAGNIYKESLRGVLARRHSIPYVAEFERGLAECADSCSYWPVCYGGYASNRYAERGRFDVASTQHCRTMRQELVNAVLDLADPQQDAAMIRQLTPLTQAPG
ncbi:radical SAM protein [Thermostaphylospora chromogena]|uniref:Radical SAM core domain-containing protein n=1 Tax=Thermostaphylospora chromogena TaxID=35622 RepID=A0A1H1FDN1_9ACTN|nr:radical SAM protein [Thermostaphylospora chromogena]SDQ98809.1 uncharacterized protein SAMN04489764_2921 [Thermostaphylospora chromogena]